MSSASFEISGDETRPQGGYAILRVKGAKLAAPQALRLRIMRFSDQQWLGDGVWQSASTSLPPIPQANVSATTDGFEVRLGPDVVDRIPSGAGLQIEIVDLGLSGRVRWHGIRTTAVTTGKGRLIEMRHKDGAHVDDGTMEKTINQTAPSGGNTTVGLVEPGQGPAPPPALAPHPVIKPIAAAPQTEIPVAPAPMQPVEPSPIREELPAQPVPVPAPKPRGWVPLAATFAILALLAGAGASWYIWVYLPQNPPPPIATPAPPTDPVPQRCNTAACEAAQKAIDNVKGILADEAKRAKK